MAKQPKAEVKYTPHGTRQEHCSICAHFEEPAGCEKVEGEISPNGWCDLFTKWSRTMRMAA